MPNNFSLHRRARGIGLIELMVAIVIGAVVSLAVFGVVSSFEGRKRTTTSVNDINQSGSYALYRIDKWIRSAGSGFSYFMDDGKSTRQYTFGCPIYATASAPKGQLLPRAAALPDPFAGVNTGVANEFRLVPVLIAPGQSAAGSDVLIVMAGTAGNAALPVSLDQPIAGSNVVLKNTMGYAVNDMILIADQASGASAPCFVSQIGNQTLATITLGGNYYAAAYASGKIPDTLGSPTISDLGNMQPAGSATNSNPPYFNLIGVGSNNTLFSYDLLKTNTAGENDAATPIADGVFEMRALYQIDSNDDGIADTWVSPSDATGGYTLANLSDASDPAALALRIHRIMAIRVGLILRTSLPEKVSAGFVAPASLPSLFADTPLPYVRSLTTADRSYRYRTLETTIPVRNALH